MNNILLYLGGTLTLIWGVSHLFPTRSVVRNFGDISEDNKQIIAMEWINEGATLIFLGALDITITYVNPISGLSKLLFGFIIGMLIVLSVISLFTGFKVNFLPYKLCPVIFTGSAILIFLGVML